MARRQPVLPRSARAPSRTLVVIEVLQWTPFALLILYTAYAAIPLACARPPQLDGAGPFTHASLHRPAADGAGDRRHLLHPLHRQLPRVRQCLRADRRRLGRLDDHHARSTSTRPSSAATTSASRSPPRSCCSSLSFRCSPAILRLRGAEGMRQPPRHDRAALGGLRGRRLHPELPGDLDVRHLAQDRRRDRDQSRRSWIEAPTLAELSRHLRACADRFDIRHYLFNSLVAAAIGAAAGRAARLPGRLCDRPLQGRAALAAADCHQPPRHPADHLLDPDLPDVPAARAARHAHRPRHSSSAWSTCRWCWCCSPTASPTCRSRSRKPPASMAPAPRPILLCIVLPLIAPGDRVLARPRLHLLPGTSSCSA